MYLDWNQKRVRSFSERRAVGRAAGRGRHCGPVCSSRETRERGAALYFLSSIICGLLRELAAGPHSQRRAIEKWGVL